MFITSQEYSVRVKTEERNTLSTFKNTENIKRNKSSKIENTNTNKNTNITWTFHF